MLTGEEKAKVRIAAENALAGMSPNAKALLMAQLNADPSNVIDKITSLTEALYAKYQNVHKNDMPFYTTFTDFANNEFSFRRRENQNQLAGDGFQSCMNYLMGPQKYSIATIDACAGMPVLGRLMGIYRHGYITIQDSPFSNVNRNSDEILELNPGGQTDETTKAAEKSNIQRITKEVPGFVTLALHLAGKELLDTGEYSLKNYRPWENDCQTYTKHAQQRMNDLLPPTMQQKHIVHFRFIPRLKEKNVQRIKRDFGFSPLLGKKGNIEFFGQNLADNFSNMHRERTLNKAPKDGIEYWPWVAKRFAKSLYERATVGSLYAFAKRSAEQALRVAFSELDKCDSKIRQITMVMANEKGLQQSSLSENVKKEEIAMLINHQARCSDALAKLSSALLEYQTYPSEKNLNATKAAVTLVDRQLEHYNSALSAFVDCPYQNEAKEDINKHRMQIRNALGIDPKASLTDIHKFELSHMKAIAQANWKGKNKVLNKLNEPLLAKNSSSISEKKNKNRTLPMFSYHAGKMKDIIKGKIKENIPENLFEKLEKGPTKPKV